jgi:glutamate-1-semialdehyde 2,1-aminomutase
MTGFRVALGGAQAHGITPDLTTFGKIIGGGMPVGAYGGRRELMQQIAPAGPIYQAGTLRQSGGDGRRPGDAGTDPAAGLPRRPGRAHRAPVCRPGSGRRRSRRGVTTTRVGAMFGLFFTSEKVETYAQATACDIPAFNRFFHAMLTRACSWHRRRTRPASCPARTMTP